MVKNPTRKIDSALVVYHKDHFLVGNATRCSKRSWIKESEVTKLLVLGGIWANATSTWNPTTLIDVTLPKGATNTG